MSRSPYINRFLSADTIVPGYANPQNLNRYSYVLNNPIKLTDPTGHICVGESVECLGNDGSASAGFTGGAALRPKPKKDRGCGGRKKSCLGIDPNNPTLRPSDPVAEQECLGGAHMCDDWKELETLLDWATHLDYAEQVYLLLMNYGRPAYKHIKGITPGGPWEGLAGASLQFLHDFGNPGLAWRQRFGRAGIVFVEDWATDSLSNYVGAPAGAATGGFIGGLLTSETGPGAVVGVKAGATIGAPAGMILVNEGMNLLWDRANPWIFNKLNLGPP